MEGELDFEFELRGRLDVAKDPLTTLPEGKALLGSPLGVKELFTTVVEPIGLFTTPVGCMVLLIILEGRELQL